MDGNGRWAKQRGLPRAMGHREGVQALKRTIQAAPDLGIQCLTVFGFSTENWARPEEEVSDLMGLVRSYVASDLNRLDREGVRLRILGRRRGLPADIAAIIERAAHDAAGQAIAVGGLPRTSSSVSRPASSSGRAHLRLAS